MQDACVLPRQPATHSRVLPWVAAVLLFSIFTALGTWQVQRRQWKHALITRVDNRVHAAPVAAPGPQQWSVITAGADEYRHVSISGTYLQGHTVLVQAVTDLGAGFWMLTPLRSTQGWLVLVNRGFVSSRATEAPRQQGATVPVVTVTGLMRMSEPGGAFLRNNAPAENRWYSRDVAAISAAQGLASVAPYFIDADARADAAVEAQARSAGNATIDSIATPVAGLTVIAFADNHLVYALTWYALALMVAGAAIWLRRAGPQRNVDSDNRYGKDTENGTDRTAKMAIPADASARQHATRCATCAA